MTSADGSLCIAGLIRGIAHRTAGRLLDGRLLAGCPAVGAHLCRESNGSRNECCAESCSDGDIFLIHSKKRERERIVGWYQSDDGDSTSRRKNLRSI